jgi:hypothetical protein
MNISEILITIGLFAGAAFGRSQILRISVFRSHVIRVVGGVELTRLRRTLPWREWPSPL